MKLKVTTVFNDMTIEDPNERRREIGTEFEASDARGAFLISLNFVETVAGTDQAFVPPAEPLHVDGEPTPLPPA